MKKNDGKRAEVDKAQPSKLKRKSARSKSAANGPASSIEEKEDQEV